MSKIVIIILTICLLMGCGIQEESESIIEGVSAISDPIERGLIWIAVSITLHGFLNLIR